MRTMTDQQINESAKFYSHHEAADESDITCHPCVELGGDYDGDGAMQVYVYAEDGKLYVSLHFDTAGPDRDRGGPWAYYGPDNAIPVVLLGGDGEPAWQATATANPRGDSTATAVYRAYQNGWDDRGNSREPQS